MSWKTTWPGVGLAKAAEAGVSTGGGRLMEAQDMAMKASKPVAMATIVFMLNSRMLALV